jgi:hypothetical protein
VFECVADVVFEACVLLSVLTSECGMLLFFEAGEAFEMVAGFVNLLCDCFLFCFVAAGFVSV